MKVYDHTVNLFNKEVIFHIKFIKRDGRKFRNLKFSNHITESTIWGKYKPIWLSDKRRERKNSFIMDFKLCQKTWQKSQLYLLQTKLNNKKLGVITLENKYNYFRCNLQFSLNCTKLAQNHVIFCSSNNNLLKNKVPSMTKSFIAF